MADCICLFSLDCDTAVPVDTHCWQIACRDYFPHWPVLVECFGWRLDSHTYAAIGERLREVFGRGLWLIECRAAGEGCGEENDHVGTALAQALSWQHVGGAVCPLDPATSSLRSIVGCSTGTGTVQYALQ